MKEQTFHGDNKHLALLPHPAKKKNDASWNLIGNPFTSYYGLETLEYDSPITVYNNETGNYETLRKGDDHYDFHPFQAFFVQKPESLGSMDFDAEFRTTKTQKDKAKAARKPMIVEADSPRKIVNLSIVQDSLSDRTRIVINPEKSISYEMDCDAAKFLADNMPQIYTEDADGVIYSINERNLGNGLVKLVVKSPKEGVCTISASRLDCKALLQDMKTGEEIDLSETDYTFLAETTTYSNRFYLKLSAGETGIDQLQNAEEFVNVVDGSIMVSGTDEDVKVFNLSGSLVAAQKGSGSIEVENGSYIVKVGGKSAKVFVNK